jgi:site-specific recombinase XerD
MKHRRPLRHPLKDIFLRAVDSLGTSLCPDTFRGYHATVKNFLNYLGADHHQVHSLEQLRRDPHILGWLASLSSRKPPLVKASYMNQVVRLRRILEELAWSQQNPDLAHLVRREDSPRREELLPRPLSAIQDELIQQELMRRNDLFSNVLLLLRHTGMRIGECIDLSCDCLRSTAPDEWAVHVPLGKLKTERMVPVDTFVCQMVRRLRFLRSIDPTPQDGFLLARPRGRYVLMRDLQGHLREVAAAAGITVRIVPHQLRHTYATEMFRSGVSFPGVMKLLGHSSPTMTMRYLKIALPDLQREFLIARSQPRHLAPPPRTPASINPRRADMPTLIHSLLVAQHVLEMFRRGLPEGTTRRSLARLANRLTKILSAARKLDLPAT